jgi:hypothetical protein
MRDHRRPVFFHDSANDQKSGLIDRHCRNLDQIGIIPKLLSLNEINPMLLQISPALLFVELKGERGIKIIPLLGRLGYHM